MMLILDTVGFPPWGGSTTPSTTTSTTEESTSATTTTSTTMRPTPPSPCKVEYTEQTVRDNLCTSKVPVKVGSCSGTCESSAGFLAQPPFYSQVCRCCKPVFFENVEVPVKCLKTGSSLLKLKIIRHCVCGVCNEAEIPATTTSPTEKVVTKEPVGSGEGSGETGSGSGSESGSESGVGSGDEIDHPVRKNVARSNAARRKRSLVDMFYNFFIGENN